MLPRIKFKYLFVLTLITLCSSIYFNKANGQSQPINLKVEVNSYITFKAIPEKISPSSNDYSSHIIIEIKNAGTDNLLYSQMFDTDINGLHSNPEILPDFEIGSYDIYAKGYSHLSKKKAGVNIVSGINFIDFSSSDTEFLLAGDVNVLNSLDPFKRGDNLVNSIDLAIEIEKLDISAEIEKEDVNKDGIINSVDLGILIENLDKHGDDF